MLKWVQRLGQHICGFNTGQNEEAYAPRAIEEEAHSPEEEEPSGEHASLSGESSSSPSHSSSSPYIPISECFTGTPVALNEEATYCNVVLATTTFDFPPRPWKKGLKSRVESRSTEGSQGAEGGHGAEEGQSAEGGQGAEDGQGASGGPPVPPPRPPKTLPSSEVTYLQLDTSKLREIYIHAGGSKVSHHKVSGGDVEYRMIDHVKTQALAQMRLEREEQLRMPASRNFHLSHKGG